MSGGTVQVEEIIWTVAAVPGLLLWARNAIDARRTLYAVLEHRLSNGRLMWAKFSRRQNTALAGVEAVFVTVGIIMLTRTPPPEATGPSRAVVFTAMILASVALTTLALDWQRVNHALISEGAREDERDAARDAERDPVRDAERDSDRDVVRDAVRDPGRDERYRQG